MKGIFSFLLAVVLICSPLTGCNLKRSQPNYLAALRSPFCANGSFTIGNSHYPVSIRSDENSVTIDAQTEEKIHLSFTAEDGLVKATIGKGSLPLPESVRGGVPALFSLLSLSRTDLCGITKERAGSEKIVILTFANESDTLTLTLKNDTLIPLKIEGRQNGTNVCLVFESFTPEPT